MKNKRSTGVDTAPAGPASAPRFVAGEQTSKPRAIAWSLTPDAELEADAKAWAKFHGVALHSCVVEETTELCGDRQSPIKTFTRKIINALDAPGVAWVLCRGGQVKHPGMPKLAEEIRANGIEIEDPRNRGKSAEDPRLIEPEKPAFSVADRLVRGRYEGARNGLHQSGPAPYGYKRDYRYRGTDEPMLAIHPEEAEVVRLIFVEYRRRGSMKRLIAYMDSLGLRTRRGKRWSRAAISWILKNDTYLGRVHFGDVRSKGKHPPIVSQIVFNKANQLMRRNDKRTRRKNDRKD